MKNWLEVLRWYSDELDRHYVSQKAPQILYVSFDDFAEIGKPSEGSVTAVYEPKSLGNGMAQPETYVDRLNISCFGYTFIFMKGEPSLIWLALKEKFKND